jgi:hypothetical protein
MLNSYKPETVPCGICGKETDFTGTERCNNCWELELRISMDPVSAGKILTEFKKTQKTK